MDLGGGQAGPVGVGHGFDHVIDQTTYFRRRGVRNGGRHVSQHRVAHAGDFQDSHRPNMRLGREREKAQKLKTRR